MEEEVSDNTDQIDEGMGRILPFCKQIADELYFRGGISSAESAEMISTNCKCIVDIFIHVTSDIATMMMRDDDLSHISNMLKAYRLGDISSLLNLRKLAKIERGEADQGGES